MPSTTVCTQNEIQRQAPLTSSKTNGEPVIFVVENDCSVRRFICALLRYTTNALVAEAADPYAALSLARKVGRPIDLLISDIHLSAVTNGVDLARELAILHPSMNVLLLSGADRPPYRLPVTWRFLPKPFTIESFLDCVGALCRPFSPPRSRPKGSFPRPAVDNIP
jgi:DNA-binding NarL/FixJ family response regulator